MARTRSTSAKPSSSSAIRTSSTAGLPYASPLSRPSGHDSPVARRLATKIAQGKLSNAEKMELKRERNRNKQRAYRDRIENQISALDRQNHQLESVSFNQAALILSLKDKILSLEDQLVQQKKKTLAGGERERRSSPKASPPSEAANDRDEDEPSRTVEGSPPSAASPQEDEPPRLIFRPNDGSPPIDLYAQKEEEEEEEEEPLEVEVEVDAGSNGQVVGGGLERIEELPDEEMELAPDGDGDGEDGAGSGMDREEEDEVEDAFNDDEEMESSISPLSFEPNNQPSSPQPFEFVNPHHLHRPSSANSDTFLLDDDDSPSQYGSPTSSSSSSSSSSGFAINPSDLLLSSPALSHNHYHYDSIQKAPIYQTSHGYHHPSELISSPLQPRAHHHQNDASSSSDPPSPTHYHHQSFSQDIHYNAGVPPLPPLPPIVGPQSSSSSSSVQQPTSSSPTAPLSRLRPRLAVVVPPTSFGVVTKPSVSNIRGGGGGGGGGRWAPLEMDESSTASSRSRNVKVEDDDDEETKRPEWRESGKGMLTRKRTSLGYQYC